MVLISIQKWHRGGLRIGQTQRIYYHRYPIDPGKKNPMLIFLPVSTTFFMWKVQPGGGFIEGGRRLSPTSMAMAENSDVLIGIGGGQVGRDELIAAKRSGKKVRFFPADMNHQKAREKAREKGISEPKNFRGAAGEAFN